MRRRKMIRRVTLYLVYPVEHPDFERYRYSCAIWINIAMTLVCTTHLIRWLIQLQC